MEYYRRNMQIMERHFPNECYVCKSTTNLFCCTNCNMICYCGENHQNQHWEKHRDLCRTISAYMREKHIMFLYEHLRDSTVDEWTEGKTQVANEVQQKLGRPFSHEEELLFKHPRVCFVCYESNPIKLKNCCGCTAATFCIIHPYSLIHDRACAIMKNEFETVEKKVRKEKKSIRLLIDDIGSKVKFHSTDDPPATVKEFFERFVLPHVLLTQNQIYLLSDYYTIVLTIFSALKAIEGCVTNETLIYFDEKDTVPGVLLGKYWETLHHFLPEIKVLKLVYFSAVIETRKEIPLCKECRSKKKRLYIESKIISFEKDLDQKNSQVPNLTCFFNTHYHFKMHEKQNLNLEVVKKWSKVTSPMLLTTFMEKGLLTMMKWLLSDPEAFCIIHEGYNHFAPLIYVDEVEDGSICQTSQFMILFKRSGVEPIPKFSLTFSEPHFYCSVCYICRAVDPKVACTRCNLIFYCSNKHRDEHRLYHRSVCRVVEVYLKNTGMQSLFEKFKGCVPELWVKVRLNFKEKIERKVGRRLLSYENQMFYFPKVCVRCHETDHKVLTICKCLAILCKNHKNDPDHMKICKELSLAYKLPPINSTPLFIQYLLTEEEIITDASSMKDFLERQAISMSLPERPYISDILTSQLISGPLTLINTMKEFNIKIDSSLVIHVIGATDPEMVSEIWSVFFLLLPELQSLKVIFVGPDLIQESERSIDTSKFMVIPNRELTTITYASRYEKYFADESFARPNIIFCSNVHFHLESEGGIYLPVWNRAFMCWKLMGVPLVLTAGVKEFVERDAKLICTYLETDFHVHFRHENPFASLAPYRDFCTEGVQYFNQSFALFDWKSKSSSSDNKMEETTIEKIVQLKLNE